MKKKTLGRIAVFAFALCMVSTCLLSGTLAKYTTEANGTGTLTVATFTGITSLAGDTVANYEFDLSATKDDNDFAGAAVIAPGDKGKFDIVLSASEVAYGYTISIANFNDNGSSIPVKFYAKEEAGVLSEPITTSLAGTKAVADANSEVTIPIYWEWATSDETNTTDNVAKNLSDKTDTFVVTITATQALE